jgi:hypothetical protein
VHPATPSASTQAASAVIMWRIVIAGRMILLSWRLHQTGCRGFVDEPERVNTSVDGPRRFRALF